MRAESKESLSSHSSCKAYVKHGFIPKDLNDTQIWGLCPFCAKENKMYVSIESKAWDCKVCGRSGGFQSFLNQMTEHCSVQFRGKIAIDLSKSRGISLSTLKHFKVGYNEITAQYVVPIFKLDGREVFDLRYYRQKKLWSTPTCKTGLLNWQEIANCKGTIWLCEGEWDGMAMFDALSQLSIEHNDIPISVPGANTFKAEWSELLRGKIVRVLYDNDKAGIDGAIKVYKNLSECKDIKFIHWEESRKEGFDIRDLWNEIKNPSEFIQSIIDLLRDEPKGLNERENVGSKSSSSKRKEAGTNYTGAGVDCKEIYKAYRNHLHLPDSDLLDIIFGTIIANRLSGDPIWLFLVAPSGMTKSELLQSISSFGEVEAISTLTPHSLVSGANVGGTDPSLIPRLNNRVLCVKDFTTIFSMNIQAKEEIFGILRDAYDGEITKIFGHGVRRHYISKFGIIAGVTPAIEAYLDGESALGERFLRYSLTLPDTLEKHLEYLRKATENITLENDMRNQLRLVANICLDYNFNPDIEIDKTIYDRILHLAICTSLMRGTILRDKFTKEITHRPFIEMGTRLSKQYIKILKGICMFKRLTKATERELLTIKTIARGTVPSKIENIVSGMYNSGSGYEKVFSVDQICSFAKLPRQSCERICENMSLLSILTKTKISPMKVEWKLSPLFVELLNKSAIYKNTDDENELEDNFQEKDN